MLSGLMQQQPLLTTSVLHHGARIYGRREIVSRTVDAGTHRYTFSDLRVRSQRLARVLLRLGVQPGDRVASLAWNTHRHLELFYAVPGIGAVLHTVNPRLHLPQIRFILEHGGAKIIFVDPNLLELVEKLIAELPQLRTCVVLAERADGFNSTIKVIAYEEALAAEEEHFDWPTFDENIAACLCYTSGTTGDPKGVLYSHRSIVLEALSASLRGAFDYSPFDCVLPAASLYHAMGWATPYTSIMNGCKLVLPAHRLDPASLHELIEEEGVTLSMGVPAIWAAYLQYVKDNKLAPKSLKRLIVGGSALPRSLATALSEYGIRVMQGWGMTETSSFGAMSADLPTLSHLSDAERQDQLWSRQGIAPFGVEMKVVDESGDAVADDGQTPGDLLVRGPWILNRYFGANEDAVDAEGWFATGDVATVDRFGFIKMSDRKKDMIKSGGEWISSIDLENAVLGCPGVQAAAVVGLPHPKWDERPVLLVVSQEGMELSQEDIHCYLAGRIVKWWMPDAVLFVHDLPMTATGKLDKKAIRASLVGYFK